ncbi:MAG: hypothetical protein M3P51_03210 [Chloroflexota bacterium]|nr:hypothetical protein [Chloroflexota bacterium]
MGLVLGEHSDARLPKLLTQDRLLLSARTSDQDDLAFVSSCQFCENADTTPIRQVTDVQDHRDVWV